MMISLLSLIPPYLWAESDLSAMRQISFTENIHLVPSILLIILQIFIFFKVNIPIKMRGGKPLELKLIPLCIIISKERLFKILL